MSNGANWGDDFFNELNKQKQEEQKETKDCRSEHFNMFWLCALIAIVAFVLCILDHITLQQNFIIVIILLAYFCLSKQIVENRKILEEIKEKLNDEEV